ncbi:MAG: hypothetical protein SV760_00775 [Halobacteria archaeon]|nr:hypothetical protein [Halobacteria archaeon]
MTDRTGPITFSHPTPREQLLEEGRVVSFRASKRTTGSTWWRKSRNGPKQGDVVVEELRKANPNDPDDLSEYVEASGFSRLSRWQEAIADTCGGELPEGGFLYEVRRVIEDGSDSIEFANGSTIEVGDRDDPALEGLDEAIETADADATPALDPRKRLREAEKQVSIALDDLDDLGFDRTDIDDDVSVEFEGDRVAIYAGGDAISLDAENATLAAYVIETSILDEL